MDTALPLMQSTYRTLTSKTAQRTLLTTVLATLTATVLYALAAFSYLVVYNTYLPDQITVLPLHLHYGVGPNPWAVASVRNMKEYQAYDISLSLTLPTSPGNLDRGNFMIGLLLLDREGTAPPGRKLLEGGDVESWKTPTVLPTSDPGTVLAGRDVLHAVSRPALAPYTDPLVGFATKMLRLPSHVLFSRESTVCVVVPLVERVSFPNAGRSLIPVRQTGGGGARSVPSGLFVEIQSGQDLRVSSAEITITAQLAGVRRFMYRCRVLSFILGSSAFWGCEVLFMGVAWLVLTQLLSSPAPEKDLPSGRGDRIKEEQEMSDTERTFPTMGRQPPLKYESSSGPVKSEKEETRMDETPNPPGVEADDEESDGGWRDSGIGTSYSDATAAGKEVRKRKRG